MSRPRHILLVEDNPADIESVRRALKNLSFSTNLGVLGNGLETRDKIDSDRLPPIDGPVENLDLILLDLKIPGIDGRKLIELFRRSDRGARGVPLVVLTTSNNQDDVRQAYRNGANAYVMKPSDMNRMLEVVESLCRYWLDVVDDPN